MSSGKAIRLIKVLTLLPKHPYRIGTRRIEELLEAAGFSVNTRMIQRDLTELSECFPIISDNANPAGWSWMEDAPCFFLPGMDPAGAAVVLTINRMGSYYFPEFVCRYVAPHVERARRIIATQKSDRILDWASLV